MLILGIETSCDDTSFAILEKKSAKNQVFKIDILSYPKKYKKFGGVVPELSARTHMENILKLVEEYKKFFPKIDRIAVTSKPGLWVCLQVGILTAQLISYLYDKPVFYVNHLLGHILSPFLNSRLDIDFPMIAMIISGGHTRIYYFKNLKNFKIIADTRDDAVGECIDKVARYLGLSYPGGPEISKLAVYGNPYAFDFPKVMKGKLGFSFSGLKTYMRYFIREHKSKLKNMKFKQDVCASFEQKIVEILLEKLNLAIKRYFTKTVIISGGVACNDRLRYCAKNIFDIIYPDIKLLFPEKIYCQDNAAMIALAGSF